MKNLTWSLIIAGFLAFFMPLQAQTPDAHDKFNDHINSIVEQVEKAETPDQKRKILDHSLSDMIQAINKAKAMKAVPGSDKESLTELEKTLSERQDELNGLKGFSKVPDSQLNNFANFIQQDLQQADKVVSISLTTLLLIIIILLLI